MENIQTLNDMILEPINEIGLKEGWNIYLAIGASDGEGYRLEKNDEDSVFCTDEDAINFVYAKALEGSEIHKNAFKFITSKENVTTAELLFVNHAIRTTQNKFILSFRGIDNPNPQLLYSDKYFQSYNELLPIIREIENSRNLKYNENSGTMLLVSSYVNKIVISVNKTGNDINDYRMLITKCLSEIK